MKKTILLHIFLLTLLISCKDFDFAMDYESGIEIKNKSNHLIGLYIGVKEYNVEYIYPDTLLPSTNKHIKYDISKILRPGTYLPPKKEREFFKELPKDTLSIFIFSTDTLNKYSWEEVRRDYKILKRYDLSYEDCVRLNFIVPYPPTPTRSRMKMYPKYGR